jgi:UDP-N-acetylglucosamine acyltransferase
MTEIHSSAIVHAAARLGAGVTVGPYCVVGEHATIGDGTRLLSHVVVDGRTRIGERCTLFPFASIGTQTQDLKFKGGTTFVEIGNDTTLREYVTVNSGTNEGEVTRVGHGCHIMAYCHVAHASRVGDRVIMSNGATLAGEVQVEDEAIIGGLVGVHQFCRVGRLCMVGGMSKITQNCPPFMIVDGNPPTVRGLNIVGMQRRQVPEGSVEALKKVHRLLFREGLNTTQAVERIRAEGEAVPEVTHLLEFVAASPRGVVK